VAPRTHNVDSFYHVYRAKQLYQLSLGIVVLSVRPSVCQSVTRVLCVETKEPTAEILTPRESIITLFFLLPKKVGIGDISIHLKFALKVIHPHL